MGVWQVMPNKRISGRRLAQPLMLAVNGLLRRTIHFVKNAPIAGS